MALLPQTLFYRFLFILLVPIILVQTLSILFFFERHWDNVSNHMRESIANEILMVTYFSQQSMDRDIAQGINKLNLNVKVLENEIFNKKNKIEDIELKNFSHLLKSKLTLPFHLTYLSNKKYIRVTILLEPTKFLQIDFSKKRIKNSTTYVFLISSIILSLIFAIVSLIFMRNQVRSIIKLSHAAQEFGKGNEIKLEPSGAQEIKSLGHSFLQMKNHLSKNIKNRTELLAHIAHDLRTPITRIKLELELLNNTSSLNNIRQNLAKIENTISNYLDFAKQEGNERYVRTDLVKKIGQIVKLYPDKRLKTSLPKQTIYYMLKINAFERAINNTIDNSIKYARNIISITLHSDKKFVIIDIDDDGKGIEKSFYEDVFKPFYKHDTNFKEGYGLGLAICKDIIEAHGGQIELDKSKYGGLNLKIKLPK